ncbi:ABC transporter ATP-binding protein [Aeromicrobium sp. YIM 150415]|uniref:ABC transporter ATP-binding protein n=1 Tax=Aeromicrobium sp. YIM 150415 TaxID=2803912 RepID=UPI001963A718|nr:ABC transporter ATP-binding protein [Aeromicrobium sp. YIM 150415]MBM9465443.1 ABC transporter ATP-binding protein [Aeromicrobium sp. YIM 150415]
MAGPRSRFSVLWSFARPHRATLFVALALGLFASGMELATPLVTKWVLDTLAAGGSITGPVSALLGLLVVGAVISWRQWILLGTLAEDIVFDARRHMIGRFLSAKVLPLLRRPTGELVTRMTSDSVLMREAASSSLVGLVNGSIVLVGTLVLMAVLDLVLFAATLAAVLVVAVLFGLLMPAIAKAQEQAQGALADLGAGTEGTLRAIKTVKAAGAEERQRERLFDDARRAREHGVRAVRREVVAWTIAWTGIQAAIIVILALGAARVAADEMAVSTLVAFLLYAFGLMGPITELSQNMTALQAGIAAAGRIREIDELESEPRSGVIGAEPSGGGIALRDVRARYGADADPALDGVSIEVPERGHIALVGPSGAGKTSVLSTVLGFLEPEDGDLRMGDTPYESLSPAQVRSRIAYVEQETPVVPGTIGENLRFVNPEASDQAVDRVLAELRLDELVEQLPDGLDTPLTDTSVSGGQRQRIAVARALLADPEVLLLDEATAQVDGITEAAIHRAIRRQAERGAVLTIAHRLSTVVDADEIIVMEHGRVAARGSHETLLQTSDLYRQLVAALVVPTG